LEKIEPRKDKIGGKALIMCGFLIPHFAQSLKANTFFTKPSAKGSIIFLALTL
jgi:hypothetical protein